MPEPTYSFTLTESERTAFAKVLGGLVSKLINAPVQLDSSQSSYTSYTSQSLPPARPADPTGTDSARAILSPPAAAQPAPPTTPIELRDRWARDRKGNELPNPDGCEAVTARIWKVERKDLSDGRARLRVTWYAPSGSGYVDANCFDDKLFPWIAAQSKEPTALLYVVKNGKYLNVAGVRA